MNVLSSLGFSSSFDAISRFGTSDTAQPEIRIMKDSLYYFTFENAGFNVDNLDGVGTYNAMGGIMSLTPSRYVDLGQNI